jgi:hypothetical protein
MVHYPFEMLVQPCLAAQVIEHTASVALAKISRGYQNEMVFCSGSQSFPYHVEHDFLGYWYAKLFQNVPLFPEITEGRKCSVTVHQFHQY